MRLANGRGSRRCRSRPSTSSAPRDFAQRRGCSTRTGLHARVIDLWTRTVTAVDTGDLSSVEREIDWVIKLRLLERYMAKHDLGSCRARIAQLDLAYHDITAQPRAWFYLLESRGAVGAADAATSTIFEAKSVPPQDHPGPAARRLHQARPGAPSRLHRRLGAPQAQRPGAAHGALQDPFRSVDERVEKLIASM